MNISRSRNLLRLVVPPPGPEAPLPKEKTEEFEGAVHGKREEPGGGNLVFGREGEKTVLRRSYAKAPLKWIRTLDRAQAAWVYGSSYGGGLVGGDHLRPRVRVEREATAFLTTQASTKVYRSELPARQTLEAKVERDGRLVWLPDPTVCFKGSDYEQRQEFHLEAGAGLVSQDSLTSGRWTRGERWKFRRYFSRTRILSEGRTVFHDALRLDPKEGPLERRMGRFNSLTLVLVYGAPFTAQRETILREWTPPKVKSNPSVLEYLGRVGKDGLVWRMAAVDPGEAAGLVKKKLSFLPEVLGGNPWARKLGFEG